MFDAQGRDNGTGEPARTRVVLFGMRCTFTHPVLTALTESPAVQLEAVVLPRDVRSSSTTSGPVMDIVRAGGTPLIEVPDRHRLDSPEFRASMERIAPDVIITACFPWRLPKWLLHLPPDGCLNVHPSLLPDGRGPEPVFWAFRWGLQETGVTLHVMDEGFDTGPVVSQRRVVIPDGTTIPGLERILAAMGAEMVIEHLSVLPGTPVVAQPQHEETARYAPIPGSADLTVPTSWTVSDAARFIRAVVSVYGAIPILVLATGQRLTVDTVIQINDEVTAAEPVLVDGETALIRFAGGSLTCRLVRRHEMVQLHRSGA